MFCRKTCVKTAVLGATTVAVWSVAAVAAADDGVSDATAAAPREDAPKVADSPDNPAVLTPTTRGVLFEVATLGGSVAGSMVRGGDKMVELVGPSVGGQFVLGYRFDRFMVGGRVLAAIGGPSAEGNFEACGNDDVTCRSAVVRYGLLARAYLLPGNPYDPWVGIGIGRERFAFSAEYDDEPIAVLKASGTELFNLSAGLDLWRGNDKTASVFVDYGLGRYTELSIDGFDLDPVAADRVFHHWIMVGGSLGFML